MRAIKFFAGAALILLAVAPVWSNPEIFPADGFEPGWKGGILKKYLSRDQLFAFMDGGAEVYLDYRFEKLEVKEYSGPDKAVLTVEIFAFENPQDAYGIFSVDTSGTAADLGQGGRVSATQARFWKGQCFVRAFAWQARLDLVGLPLKAAQAVAAKIESANLPDWLQTLVGDTLAPIFLRSETALSRTANVSLPRDLSLNGNSGAAWIRPAGFLTGCAVLAYADSSSARETFKALWNNIVAQAKGSARSQMRGMAAISDSLTQGVQQVGSLVIWVPAAKNEVTCGAMLDRVGEVLGQK
jgi:hypothetical protein